MIGLSVSCDVPVDNVRFVSGVSAQQSMEALQSGSTPAFGEPWLCPAFLSAGQKLSMASHSIASTWNACIYVNQIEYASSTQCACLLACRQDITPFFHFHCSCSESVEFTNRDSRRMNLDTLDVTLAGMQARPMCPSSTALDQSLRRCLWAWVLGACGICLQQPRSTPPASCFWMSWMLSAAAATPRTSNTSK